ncbi:MAG: YlxR family protein [Oscillospiraceae bacterium]|nr:YlxR family protein [Oscillospiraceae bacterium]
MQKKIPLRQCLGCREMRPKKELIRIVRSPEGTVFLDTKGKAAGRGAYLCPNAQCFKRIVKSKALSRAFDTEIPQEIYDSLALQMEEHTNGA